MSEPQDHISEVAPDRAPVPSALICSLAAVTLALGLFPGLVAGFIEKASVLRW